MSNLIAKAVLTVVTASSGWDAYCNYKAIPDTARLKAAGMDEEQIKVAQKPAIITTGVAASISVLAGYALLSL